MTVRRDLQLLEASGHVRIVHGGVVLVRTGLSEPAFEAAGDAQGRTRIGVRAAEMVGDTDAVAVDAGATPYEVARALPTTFQGTVITHSVPVIQLLAERRGPPRLVALGGELLPERQAFVGPATLDAAAQLRARTLFLSVAAIDPRGMYSCSVAEASVQRRLMDIADHVVLLAGHATFGGSAPALLGALDRLTAVVTDRLPPRSIAGALSLFQ